MEYNQHKKDVNVKITMINRLLAFIAPHHCCGCDKLGTTLCDRCKNNILNRRISGCVICHKSLNNNGICKQHRKPYDKLWCVSYRQDELASLIDQFKFKGVREAYLPLADLLFLYLPTLPKNTVVVPIPTTAHSIRVRSFDHMKLVAKQLAKQAGLSVNIALVRQNNKTQHFAKSAKERREQAKSFFKISKNIDLDKPHLIVDDIFTTGATVDAAAECLREAGIKKIWVAVIARQR